MYYNFNEIEVRWQKYWQEHRTYHVDNHSDAPHYYVLDMFPYPSGAGLHVGHPLGYIASDIFARYKRLQGFNVLHPMGYDAYGLPAEQYALQTGQHPARTTERNIARYREQLDKIGFSFDWDREVRTCDPAYYRWTQWTFVRLFNSYYDNRLGKACPIADLEAHLSRHGTDGLDAAGSAPLSFTAEQWNGFDAVRRSEVLMNYRLAYLADTAVNWCPGHRAGQRRGGERRQRARRLPRGTQAHAAVVAPHHRLRPTAGGRPRPRRLDRLAQRNPAQLDWSQRRGLGALRPGRRQRSRL